MMSACASSMPVLRFIRSVFIKGLVVHANDGGKQRETANHVTNDRFQLVGRSVIWVLPPPATGRYPVRSLSRTHRNYVWYGGMATLGCCLDGVFRAISFHYNCSFRGTCGGQVVAQASTEAALLVTPSTTIFLDLACAPLGGFSRG